MVRANGSVTASRASVGVDAHPEKASAICSRAVMRHHVVAVSAVSAVSAVWGLMLAMLGAPAPGQRLANVEPATGAIIAPVNHQAGWLSLDAPRPRLVTSFAAPSYVADLDVASTGWMAMGVNRVSAAAIARAATSWRR